MAVPPIPFGGKMKIISKRTRGIGGASNILGRKNKNHLCEESGYWHFLGNAINTLWRENESGFEEDLGY